MDRFFVSKTWVGLPIVIEHRLVLNLFCENYRIEINIMNQCYVP